MFIRFLALASMLSAGATPISAALDAQTANGGDTSWSRAAVQVARVDTGGPSASSSDSVAPRRSRISKLDSLVTRALSGAAHLVGFGNSGIDSASYANAVSDSVLRQAPFMLPGSLPPDSLRLFASKSDSVSWTRYRAMAWNSHERRIVVSIYERRLWVVDGNDTLRSVPVAVARGDTIYYHGQMFAFVTPRGRRTILSKQANPNWVPPEWHYVEVAREHHLKLQRLSREKPAILRDGRKIMVLGDQVGIVGPDSTFAPLSPDEEIAFDSTLYIAPIGTVNRQIAGELGRFRLALGDGYFIHGTPYEETVGQAATHGCIRLHDADIEWLYNNINVGTPVYIY